MSLSNYPPGVSDNTFDAPWNDSPTPDKDFDITCTQVLSKTVTVTTNNYIPGACGVDYETDEDGVHAIGWQDDDDTSDTCWADEYHDNDYYTPLQLIELFKQFLEEQKKQGIVFKSPAYTDHIISECEDWSEDETEYTE